MDNVRIAVLSAYDQVCAFLDNSLNEAMHYYDDTLHVYLKGSAYTFEFKTSTEKKESNYLVEGNKLSFKYKGKGYYFNIVKVVKDEEKVDILAYGLSFELLNEEVGEYKANSAMTFIQYVNAFNFESEAITFGINEVVNDKITLEWTGNQTVLARMFSLADKFGAELEFVTLLNKDYSLKNIVLNVYKEHSDDVQGIGTDRRNEKLKYGKEITGVTKSSDISDLYTAIRATGKDQMTLGGLGDIKVYDSNGSVEYIHNKGAGEILAPQARDRFPSTLEVSSTGRYICKIWSYDTDNINTLYGQALKQLKDNCVPKLSYEVDGYIYADVGDTFTIEDSEYNPTLYVEARITEQQICFTDETKSKTTFDNFKEVQSEISLELLAKMNELIEANKTYVGSIISSNGTLFKTNTDTTILKALVSDGGSDITQKYTIKWYKDGSYLSTGDSITVNASDFTNKALYKFDALNSIENIKATAEATLMYLSDGKAGESAYIHIAYATSSDGSVGFSTTNSVDKTFIGQYTDHTQIGSQIYSDYMWSKLKGDTGEKGDTGVSGKDGIGISSTNITYQIGTSGTVPPTGTWSSSIPSVIPGEYLWTKTTITYTSGEPLESTLYSVSLIGNGVQSVAVYFATSTDKTAAPSTGWVTTCPVWSTGLYLWKKTTFIYTDGTSLTTTPEVDSSWEAVNDISVGGRNYYALSLLYNKSFASNPVTITSSTYYVETGSSILLEPSTQYCFSYDYELLKGIEDNMRIGICGCNGTESDHAAQVDYITWTMSLLSKKQFIFTTPSALTYPYLAFRILNKLNDSSEYSIKIFNIKLEKGNQKTDWVPAVEDINNNIVQIANSLSASEQNIANISSNLEELTSTVGDVKSVSDNNSSHINSMQTSITQSADSIKFVQTQLDQTNSTLSNDYVSKVSMSDWMEFSNGILSLGTNRNKFSTNLSNTQLTFKDGDTAVAWISNKQLNILQAIIRDFLSIGNFTLDDDDDKGFTIK